MVAARGGGDWGQSSWIANSRQLHPLRWLLRQHRQLLHPVLTLMGSQPQVAQTVPRTRSGSSARAGPMVLRGNLVGGRSNLGRMRTECMQASRVVHAAEVISLEQGACRLLRATTTRRRWRGTRVASTPSQGALAPQLPILCRAPLMTMAVATIAPSDMAAWTLMR